ncbi:MAG: hypothetical protein KDI75_10005 [Xanthomonadales bacterium]|nr:hypothetical protein [Xanthomonadales bacterium]
MNHSPWSYVLPIALGVFLGIMAAFVSSLFLLGLAVDSAQQQANSQMTDLLNVLPHPRQTMAPKPSSTPIKVQPVATGDTRPRYPGSKDSMRPGTLACHFGFIQRRTRDGWEPLMTADGQSRTCRSSG